MMGVVEANADFSGSWVEKGGGTWGGGLQESLGQWPCSGVAAGGVGACTRQGTWGKLDRMKWWGRRPQPEPLLSLCSRSWVLAAGDRAGKGHVKTHDGR